jgi:hypothetical protein
MRTKAEVSNAAGFMGFKPPKFVAFNMCLHPEPDSRAHESLLSEIARASFPLRRVAETGFGQSPLGSYSQSPLSRGTQ